MPELPEVETVMRGIERAIGHDKIMDVDKRRAGLRVPFPRNLKQKLTGRKIVHYERRAKYMLVHLDDSQVLVIHLGMSGRILLVGGKEKYAVQKHDHLIITFKKGMRLIFNDARRFGMVLLMDEADLADHPAFRDMGPEPLGNDFSAPVLAQALQKRSVAIKGALMDQKVVAGLGNIYVCEALYFAGISPFRKACDVSVAETEKLVRAIRDVLKRAIKAGGSSLRDYRQADGSLGYFQHGFVVYDREGQACPDCSCINMKNGGIKRAVQAGRSSFYCPRKQG